MTVLNHPSILNGTARGLLFTPEMARSVVARLKEVTRRKLSKQQKSILTGSATRARGLAVAAEACPYGKPDDWVYVREGFRLIGVPGGACIQYRCDGRWFALPGVNPRESYKSRKVKPVAHPRVPDVWIWPWKPNLLLPRRWARAVVRIACVSVEPVQEITEQDALREGLWPFPSYVEASITAAGETARERFITIWEQINDAPGRRWADNPDVQRIEFDRFVIAPTRSADADAFPHKPGRMSGRRGRDPLTLSEPPECDSLRIVHH